MESICEFPVFLIFIASNFIGNIFMTYFIFMKYSGALCS